MLSWTMPCINYWCLDFDMVRDEFPDGKVHGANMGPTWVLSAPDGPHVSPMNLVIMVITTDGISNRPNNQTLLLRHNCMC